MASIFEENHLCPSSSQLSSEQFCNAESIFVQDENKFIFNNIQTSQARFKLANSSKFPCVLILTIKSVGPKVRHLKSLKSLMDKCIQDLWYSTKKFDQIKCIF